MPGLPRRGATGGLSKVTADGAYVPVLTPTTQAVDYTAVAGDMVLVDSTAANRTVTTPAAANNTYFGIKKTDSSTHTVTITPASGTVDGAASLVVTHPQTAVVLRSDGTNWTVVNGYRSKAALDLAYDSLKSGGTIVNTAGDVTLSWQADPDSATGIGLKIARTAAAAKFPALILAIDSTSHFATGGLDTSVANAILLYDYNIDGAGRSGDTLRAGHGANFILGDGIGAPSNAIRLDIVSTAADISTMRTLLQLDINTGSPVTRFARGTSGAGTTVWEVNWVSGATGSMALGRAYAGTAGTTGAEINSAALVFATDADPKLWLSRRGTSSADWYWRIDNAATGSKLNRVTLRYNTGGIDAMQAYTAGGVGFGNGSALATTATDGFVHMPNMAGTPTGVPTTYDTRTPIVLDTTGSKLWAYIGGWKSVALA